MDYRQISYVMTNILNSFTFIIYAINICKTKQSVLKQLILFAIIFCIDITVYFSFDSAFAYSMTGVILFIVIIFYISHEIVTSITYGLIWAVFVSVVETISTYLVSYTNGMSIEEMIENDMTYTSAIIIARLLQFIFAVLCGKVKNRSRRNRLSLQWIGLFIVLLGSIAILDINVRYVTTYTGSLETYSLVWIAVLLVIFDFAVYFLFEQKEKAAIVKEENIQLKDYVEKQNLEFSYEKKLHEKEAMFRHDMKNYVLLLKKYAEEGKMEELIASISEKYNSLEYKKDIYKTGNEYVDIILSNKIGRAENMDIKVNADVQMMSDFGMDGEDIIIMFGNLLDNAIEGTLGCENPSIDIYMICKKGKFTLELKNTVKENIKIRKDNSIKSTKSGEGHGLGLRSVKSIVEKYEGQLMLSCENHIFKVTINMVA